MFYDWKSRLMGLLWFVLGAELIIGLVAGIDAAQGWRGWAPLLLDIAHGNLVLVVGAACVVVFCSGFALLLTGLWRIVEPDRWSR